MNAEYEQLIVPRMIDSRLKLQLLMQFFNHPGQSSTAAALSERIHEAPWEMSDALEGLAACGLLSYTVLGGPACYRLGTQPNLRRQLEHLADAFNDPLLRDEIYSRVREAQRESQFSTCLNTHQRAVGHTGLVIA